MKVKWRKRKFHVSLHGSAWRWQNLGDIRFYGPFMVRILYLA